MTKRRTRQIGDATPVTGGVALPARLVAPPPCDDDVPSDDLGRQAYWLLKMNADKVALRFRQSDLASMDDDTKRQLIADIQLAIGVMPFQKAVL
ncbi:MAG: hypothetical protein EA424_29375 [Planctomycetaceae bacterium]|nr:MAG: hypothetical protein EA424_29375 [Planctomycetaceae bacterium]